MSVIDKYCIVRCNRSGVFAGTVKALDGQTAELENVRKLWCWYGANSVEDIAVSGVKKPGNCKFTVSVDNLIVTDAIQILPATEAAQKCIGEVPVWIA